MNVEFNDFLYLVADFIFSYDFDDIKSMFESADVVFVWSQGAIVEGVEDLADAGIVVAEGKEKFCIVRVYRERIFSCDRSDAEGIEDLRRFIVEEEFEFTFISVVDVVVTYFSYSVLTFGEIVECKRFRIFNFEFVFVQ